VGRILAVAGCCTVGHASVWQLLERRARELELMIGKLMKESLLSEEVQEEIGRGLGLIKDTAAAQEVQVFW